jgi:hypothetical protein
MKITITIAKLKRFYNVEAEPDAKFMALSGYERQDIVMDAIHVLQSMLSDIEQENLGLTEGHSRASTRSRSR